MIETIALVPAAGLSRRFGSGKGRKVFYEIQGRPLLWHTLDRLSDAPSVKKIVMALHSDDFSAWESLPQLTENSKKWKPLHLVVGGETRTHSVHNALQKAREISDGDDFLACVHDAARPWISREVIERTIQKAVETNAAACALSLVDTIKEVCPDGSLVTLSREKLKVIQTPQVIRADLFFKAYKNWEKMNFFKVTDDLQLLEPLRCKISLVEGCQENLKVTYSEDIK